MEKYKILTVIIIASLLAGGFVLYKPGGPAVAIVKKVVNDVKYKLSDKDGWDAAKASQILADHDEIRTGPKSLAVILFTDGSGQLRVRENSVLQIYGRKDNKQLNKNTLIQNGTVSFDVSKQSNEEFKFTTPTAVASIRGTGGLLGANNDSTFLSLEHGSVDFQSLVQGGGGGTVNGGQTGVIYKDGRFISRQSNQNDLMLLQSAKNTNTKKLKVKVNNQILEIEYLSQ